MKKNKTKKTNKKNKKSTKTIGIIISATIIVMIILIIIMSTNYLFKQNYFENKTANINNSNNKTFDNNTNNRSINLFEKTTIEDENINIEEDDFYFDCTKNSDCAAADEFEITSCLNNKCCFTGPCECGFDDCQTNHGECLNEEEICMLCECIVKT